MTTFSEVVMTEDMAAYQRDLFEEIDVLARLYPGVTVEQQFALVGTAIGRIMGRMPSDMREKYIKIAKHTADYVSKAESN